MFRLMFFLTFHVTQVTLHLQKITDIALPIISPIYFPNECAYLLKYSNLFYSFPTV